MVLYFSQGVPLFRIFYFRESKNVSMGWEVFHSNFKYDSMGVFQFFEMDLRYYTQSLPDFSKKGEGKVFVVTGLQAGNCRL